MILHLCGVAGASSSQQRHGDLILLWKALSWKALQLKTYPHSGSPQATRPMPPSTKNALRAPLKSAV